MAGEDDRLDPRPQQQGSLKQSGGEISAILRGSQMSGTCSNGKDVEVVLPEA